MTLAVNPVSPLPATALRIGLLLALAPMLTACGFLEGTKPYHGPDSVIATSEDRGRDNTGLVDGQAAIAYDPDGCQVWIIDDGLEGYSSPRFDPATGLPVCDDKYPPGTVIGVYETANAGIRDYVPGQTKRP